MPTPACRPGTRWTARSTTDATLSALALSGVTLDPTFVSSTETYTATVGNAVTETTVTATPTHPGATVALKDGDDTALTNPVTLAVGANVIKAVVTAQDTTTMKTYMVTVTREATTTTAPAIVTDGVQVTSTPMATTDTYGLGETIAITVTFDNAVTVDTSGGTPRIQFNFGPPRDDRWAEYSSGSGGTALVFTYTVQAGDRDDDGIWLAGNLLQLQSGTISAAADTTVDATLTYAQPGLQTGHKVNGSLTTTDATLSALALSGVTLAPPFVSSTDTYTATVGNAVMQTTVTATPTHPDATVAFKDGDDTALTNPVTLAVGANVIKAVVTAPDTTTMKTYMVTVTREATDNADPIFSDGDSTSRDFNETIGDAAVSTAANIDTPVEATDTNAGDTLTYSLEGADVDRFGIVTTSGQLRTKVGEKYSYEEETSYTVTVKVVDGHGGTDTVSVTIDLTDVAEPPARPAAPSVSSVADSTTSLLVTWTAPLNTGRPAIDHYDLRYREGTSGGWTDGPQDVPGPSATIMSLTANTRYQVQVLATNDEGDSLWSPAGEGQTNTAGNTAPMFSSSTFRRSVAENSPAGTDVGNAVTATDADNDPLRYTLAGTDAASFTIVSTSGQIRTRSGVTYDREAKASYTMMVKADDGAGGTDTVTVTIDLTDVAEPPRAPAAPSVRATPNTTDSLSVSWSAPSNTGRPAIDSYDLQYREDTSGGWTNGPQNVRGTSATITDLTADRAAYQVRVRATNAEGDGPWSPPGRVGGGGGGGGGGNDPPLAVDDAAETVEGTAVFIDVLANDSDPNGDTLTVVEVSAPAHGTAVVAAAGTVAYTPEPDFHGTDRFTYVVGDGSGLTARAAVEVTVRPVNDPPVAVDDAAETPEDTPVTIAVLRNDSDGDGDALALVEASAPAHGSARLTDAGAVEYTPEPDFHGTDRFTYVVGDGSGLTAQAAVDVTVRPVNDPPLATGVIPDQRVEVGDGPAVLDLIPFFADRDGDALGYTVVVSDQAVAVRLTGAMLTLTATRLGTATVTVTAQDPGGLTATQAFLVTTTDHQARGVVEDTLAALGRGHLASARATLGRRVETTGQEASQVTVAGLHVPLGTGAAAAGWAVAERWITGLAGGMPLPSGGRTGMAAAPGAAAVGAPGALGAPAARLGMAGGAPFGEGASPTRSNWSPLSAGGQTEFLLALGRGQAGDGAAQGPTVWGQLDQQAFGGERSPAARYDGHLRTAYVGFDGRLSERWLAGMAVSRSRGDGDWTVGSSAGRLTTTLTLVHPYLRWSDGGTTIWATAGAGHGSAEHERVRYGLQEESALGLRLGLVEVRRRLATVGGGVELQLRGDASWARLTTDAGDELIDALAVDVHQLRVGIDVSRPVRTAGGTLVEPFGEVHARRDGGAGQTGAGLEVAGGLRVARGVFRVEGMGRLLALHAADGYREHGGAVTLSVGDGARQPGLTLSLSPRWGARATASDALWQEEVYGQATGGTGADERALDARVDYGLTLPAGGLLIPFGVYGQTPYGRRLQVGLLINRLGPVGLEVSGERTPSRDPGGGVYRVSVRGRITVGGADNASASPDAGQKAHGPRARDHTPRHR